jgi:hypothetical protein
LLYRSYPRLCTKNGPEFLLVGFLNQNHLQLQVLVFSSAAWMAELLNPHIARSGVPVVLAHLPEFQHVLTSHVESHPTSCLPSRLSDYALHELISSPRGNANKNKCSCMHFE